MKKSDTKKPKDKEPEIDFTQFTVDDIARADAGNAAKAEASQEEG